MKSENRVKKPYESPALLVYGNLASVTHTAGNKTLGDGGAPGNMDKTS